VFFFSIAMASEVGYGEHTLFWTGRWLHERFTMELPPHLYAVIPKRRTKCRTAQEALTNRAWVSDILEALTVE
jgi:hypothetical protein